MRRPLAWGVVCGLGLAISSLSVRGAEPGRSKAAERREAVERILEQPLDWELDDREQVTLAELIEHVRNRHGLSIRWDAATFALLGGSGGSLTSGLGLKAQYCPPTQYPPVTGYASDIQYFPPPPLVGAPTYSSAALTAISPAAPVPLSGNASAVPPTAGVTPGPLNPEVTAPSKSVLLPAAVAATLPAVEKPAAAIAPPVSPMPSPSGPPAPASKVLPATASTPAVVSPGPDGPISPLLADESKAIPPVSAPAKAESKDQKSAHEEIARVPVSREALGLEGATVHEALRQMLDAAVPPIGSMGEGVGVPIVTRAMTLDYVIEGNSVLITTQLRANTRKETRVYRIGHLKTVPPESLSRVIMHTVRPWSWRNQATEIAERLAARWPKGDLLKLPLVNLDGVELLSGITLTSGQATSGAGGAMPAAGTAVPQTPPGQVSDEAIAATGQLLAGGAVATVQSIVAALEIVHHGDPPTGVIEALPGMLVITQSQGAHREIAALLEDLAASAE